MEAGKVKEKDVKKIVREGYGTIAGKGGSCCGPAGPCCCGASKADEISSRIGYGMEELKSVPEGANLGLGCGNPVALVSLQEGETVVDLGSGPGLDSFLAANAVGETGKVIGVDMTHEMLEKARENARKDGYENVEFRLGEIENLPIADASADAIISNCVINLSPDKRRVFQEAFRVLRPGGRLVVSDIVLEGELPQRIRESAAAYVGCVSGAVLRADYFRMLEEAGFEEIEVESAEYPLKMMFDTAEAITAGLHLSPEEMEGLERLVVSAKIRAVKPA